MCLRGRRRQLVRKAKKAGALFGGRKPSRRQNRPYGSGGWRLKGRCLLRTKGGPRSGDDFVGGLVEGEPYEAIKLKRASAPDLD